jgi:hypothetical protein
VTDTDEGGSTGEDEPDWSEEDYPECFFGPAESRASFTISGQPTTNLLEPLPMCTVGAADPSSFVFDCGEHQIALELDVDPPLQHSIDVGSPVEVEVEPTYSEEGLESWSIFVRDEMGELLLAAVDVEDLHLDADDIAPLSLSTSGQYCPPLDNQCGTGQAAALELTHGGQEARLFAGQHGEVGDYAVHVSEAYVSVLNECTDIVTDRFEFVISRMAG